MERRKRELFFEAFFLDAGNMPRKETSASNYNENVSPKVSTSASTLPISSPTAQFGRSTNLVSPPFQAATRNSVTKLTWLPDVPTKCEPRERIAWSTTASAQRAASPYRCSRRGNVSRARWSMRYHPRASIAERKEASSCSSVVMRTAREKIRTAKEKSSEIETNPSSPWAREPAAAQAWRRKRRERACSSLPMSTKSEQEEERSATVQGRERHRRTLKSPRRRCIVMRFLGIFSVLSVRRTTERAIFQISGVNCRERGSQVKVREKRGGSNVHPYTVREPTTLRVERTGMK